MIVAYCLLPGVCVHCPIASMIFWDAINIKSSTRPPRTWSPRCIIIKLWKLVLGSIPHLYEANYRVWLEVVIVKKVFLSFPTISFFRFISATTYISSPLPELGFKNLEEELLISFITSFCDWVESVFIAVFIASMSFWNSIYSATLDARLLLYLLAKY